VGPAWGTRQDSRGGRNVEVQKLSNLLVVMETQLQIMEDLTALCRKQSLVLVTGGLEDLDILLQGEQALIWRMGRLEERRFHLQREVAASMGIHPAGLTLERLLSDCPTAQTPRCREIAQRYGSAAGELMEANQQNAELLKQAMAFVDFSMQAMGARDHTHGKVYSPRGNQGPTAAPTRRLDNRV
jgi:flagellar biosynthesis/type III secretory pathway chaperone